MGMGTTSRAASLRGSPPGPSVVKRLSLPVRGVRVSGVTTVTGVVLPARLRREFFVSCMCRQLFPCTEAVQTDVLGQEGRHGALFRRRGDLRLSAVMRGDGSHS